MGSPYSEELIQQLMAVTKGIKPEPQYSTISTYLARCSDRKLNTKEVVVHLTNSHGVQLRSDVNYWIGKREKNKNCETERQGPILDFSHLKVIENYGDLMTKLRDLPEEWTVIQITKQYSPTDVLEAVKHQSDTGIFLTRFSCGALAERVHPYYVTIKSRNHTDENFIQLFRDLCKIRNDYFSSGGVSRKLKEAYASADCSLAKLLSELEKHWLEAWRCLLVGRLEDRNLENETYKLVKKALHSFKRKNKKLERYKEESVNIVYQLTLAVHTMKNNEILKVLNYALYNRKTENEDVNEMIPLMEDLKAINWANSSALRRAKKLPVILIIDKVFEIIPWEMLSLLSGEPTTRMLSLHLLYGLYKYHEAHIVDGYRVVKIDSGFCLINPNKDLDDCEREITQFLKRHMPWIEAEAGKVPKSKLLVSKFQDSNVFLYCGHGSGRQYISLHDFKKSFVNGIVLLFGCSSILPKTAGGRTPYHNDTYTYLTNGCPCQIGCIYDITSSDADSACKEMLGNILPTSEENDPGKMKKPKEPDVLKGIIAGKSVCKKYWSECSFVARGLPCKTEAGDVSNRT